MRFCDTPKMSELKDIYEPYQDSQHNFSADTPQKALDAYNEYLKLLQEQREKEIASWFD